MIGPHRAAESRFLVGPHQSRHVEVSVVVKGFAEMIRRARNVPEVSVMNMRSQFSDAFFHRHSGREPRLPGNNIIRCTDWVPGSRPVRKLRFR